MKKCLIFFIVTAVFNADASIPRLARVVAKRPMAFRAALAAASAKEGYDMHRDEQEGKTPESYQNGPVTMAVFYWGTKIGMWLGVGITAGAAVKGVADGCKGKGNVSDAAIKSAETFANSTVKLATGYGIATSSSGPIAEASIAWAGGPAAAGFTAGMAVPSLVSAATGNPATAALVTEVATGSTIVCAKTVICSKVAGIAANIEACAQAAGAVGLAIPWLP